jgi:hypothetical protein
LHLLSVGPRYIYLHDFGAPVGLNIAMSAPEQVLGFIIQNANAHKTGMDWRVMQLPGRMETQRSLIADYLAQWQPEPS